MLRDTVAQHYRAKGYTIRERAQVRGASGTVHTVDMVAMGPLGNLVIALEDDGGFEGPEMHAVRRAARDVGATAVMAAMRVPEGLRKAAAEAGVVLLDQDAMALETVDAPVSTSTIEYEPWPETGRGDDDGPAWAGDRREKESDIWQYPRGGQAKKEGFDWLHGRETVAPGRPAIADEGDRGQELAPDGQPLLEVDMAAAVGAPAKTSATASAPLVQAPASRFAPASRGFDWRWAITGLVMGASAGGAFYALSRILG